jgi:hypothetical protein
MEVYVQDPSLVEKENVERIIRQTIESALQGSQTKLKLASVTCSEDCSTAEVIFNIEGSLLESKTPLIRPQNLLLNTDYTVHAMMNIHRKWIAETLSDVKKVFATANPYEKHDMFLSSNWRIGRKHYIIRCNYYPHLNVTDFERIDPFNDNVSRLPFGGPGHPYALIDDALTLSWSFTIIVKEMPPVTVLHHIAPGYERVTAKRLSGADVAVSISEPTFDTLQGEFAKHLNVPKRSIALVYNDDKNRPTIMNPENFERFLEKKQRHTMSQ